MIDVIWELKMLMVVASFSFGYVLGTISQIFLS